MSNANDSIPKPEYGRLRNFWQTKTDTTEGSGSKTLPSQKSSGLANGSSKFTSLKNTLTSPVSLEDRTSNHQPEPTDRNDDMAELTQSALEFDQEILGGSLAEFLSFSKQLGGDVAEHAQLVQKAFLAQRNFLAVATKCARPGDADFQKLLAETANAISTIQTFRESRRASPVFNHLSGVSESIPALAWVTIAPTPGPHIKEMNDAGQFYTNRVLKDFKDKPGHAEWARSWVSTLNALQAYVKKNHTTGLVWGKQPFASGGPAAGPGGPPPPPPPPTYELDFENMNVSDDRAALFAELNQGNDVTKGLKKVTADMQTHKNPNLRGSSVVKAGSQTTGMSNSNSVKTPVAKPPKFGLEGKKWVVEHQIGQKSLLIGETEMNQVVYVYGCKDSTLQVKGKLNSIVVDSCVKTALVFDNLLASVEFVNCRDCQTQVMGSVPTITVDKVDGLQMFLSKESLNVEIISAKSSALNVMVPKPDGEFVEWPVPEQFKTTIGPSGLTTTASECAG